MRLCAVALILALALACRRRDRDQELAQCVDIQRSMYVTGQVRDCLVKRYGWSADDAARADREHLGPIHPDSASQSDSGRLGDTTSKQNR